VLSSTSGLGVCVHASMCFGTPNGQRKAGGLWRTQPLGRAVQSVWPGQGGSLVGWDGEGSCQPIEEAVLTERVNCAETYPINPPQLQQGFPPVSNVPAVLSEVAPGI